MNEKKIIVYYRERVCTNSVQYDEDETGREIAFNNSTQTKTLIKKEFLYSDIKKAFEEENGDGDDSGSYDINIMFITNEKDIIIFEPDRLYNQICNDYKNLNNMKKSKIFDRYKNNFIENLIYMGGLK